jgi:glycosyltransferase involved in cell wall biosynthesis
VTEPLVSIVMPTYNRPDTFRVALESVVGQSYRNIEVIVADDGTDERTPDLVRALEDSRVTYLRNPTDIDALENTRLGFEAANGELLAGCHDDDFWHSEFLARLVPPLVADPELVMSFCDLWVVDGAGEVDEAASDGSSQEFGRAQLAPGKHLPGYDIVMRGAAATQLGVVVRSGLADWNSFPREARHMFDRWFAYRVCRTGGGAYYVPERLAYSRESGQNSTALLPLSWSASGAYIYEAAAKDPAMGPVRGLLRQQAATYRTIEATVRLKRGDTGDARRAALRSLRDRPTVKGAAALLAALLPSWLLQRLLPQAS